MIRQTLRMARWEVIKLRRRWMPWVFLAFIVLSSQLRLLTEYQMYSNADPGRIAVQAGPANEEGEHSTISISCLDIRDGLVESRLSGIPTEFRQAALQEVESLRDRCPALLGMYDFARTNFLNNATLPGSLSYGINMFGTLGYLFVMILAAMAIGVEYTWGTARQVLAKGCGRGRFLAAKVLGLLAVVGIGHLAVILFMGISSLIITYTMAGTGISTDVMQWLRPGADVVKSMYMMLPYIILGTFFAVLTSSASSGIVISVVFYISESILRWIIGSYLGPDAARILISVNTPLWMASLEFPALNNLSEIYNYLRDFLSTFLPILAYIVVFWGGSFWLFKRRDLKPSTGV
ncbi:MAG: ABC transporter permease [Gemmatimonadetes bacterium]|nr:ABC transporter permease [Gemmatimonadota bacterium]